MEWRHNDAGFRHPRTVANAGKVLPYPVRIRRKSSPMPAIEQLAGAAGHRALSLYAMKVNQCIRQRRFTLLHQSNLVNYRPIQLAHHTISTCLKCESPGFLRLHNDLALLPE
jgi:hypothetical protein